MGIKVGRIEKEYILGSVRDKQIELNVRVRQQQFTACVKKFDTKQIILTVSGGAPENLQEGEELQSFFSYFGHTMTFETKIIEDGPGTVTCGYPENLIKNLERKYERVVPPENVSVHFISKGQKIVLDFPRSEEYNPAHKPAAVDEIENTSLQGLMNDFRAKAQEIVSSETIKMFRGRKPETFEERAISRYGKMLYIPQTESYKFELDRCGDIDVIDQEKIRNQLHDEGTLEKNLQLKIESIIAEKRTEDIFSELYCPILYQEYVAGYIYLANNYDKHRAITEALIEYVDQFSKILAYSLKIHGYFKGKAPEAVEYSASIVDISASGLLFAHPADDLAENFVLYTDFDLVMQFDRRKMVVPSRVMRRFDEEDTHYYGILFLEMQPEDFRYLFDLIYGREFTREDEDVWEGGAAPPTVDLFEGE
jgi:hypothetical protein